MKLVHRFQTNVLSGIFLFALSFLVFSCGETTTPKTKEIPPEVLEEKTTETTDLIESVEMTDETKSAILEKELANLESMVKNESTPSRSSAKKEGAPIPRGSYEECVKNCDKILDKMEHSTQSGSTVNAHNDCMDGCKELLKVKNAFMECIKGAKDEEAKKKCRQTYMDERPW